MKDLKSTKLIGIALLAMCGLSLSVFAQTPAPKPAPKPTPPEDEVIKVNSRLVVVPVSVTDANGQPVTGLTTADFRVLEENRNQTLDNVAGADKVPLEIALLFDVSASTDAMFKFELETAAKFLKDIMKPEDRATIYTIGQTPVLVQGRDTSERSINSLISLAATKGATAFFDTVATAARYLSSKAPEGSRKVILVISDGEDNFSEGLRIAQRMEESKISSGKPDPDYKQTGKVVALAQQQSKLAERKKVLKLLNDGDIVFYSINPAGSSFLLNQISVFGQENMKEFAETTGGSAYLPKFQPIDTKDAHQNTANQRRNGEMLDRIFNQLASELRSQYLIQYYSESEYAPNKFVRLDVSVPNRGNARVRARQGYYAKN